MYRNTLTTITSTLALTINLVFSQVVINEIHYNPASSQGSDNYYEFIELHNTGAADVDMEGWVVSVAIDHVFEAGATVAAGGYFILAKNSDYYDGSTQWGSGGINNGGELILIKDAAGVTIDSVAYDDGNGWPTNPDGVRSPRFFHPPSQGCCPHP